MSSLITLAMVAGLVGLVGPAANAATLVVDDDLVQCPTATHNSIQDAINAAAPGDTIEVCAGTYGGIVVGKALTIEGPNAGVSALSARAPEAHIMSGGTTVLIQSPDVTVDGFQVTGDFGIYVDTAATSNFEASNNIVTGSSWALGLVSGSGSGYTFAGNHLTSPVRTFHLSAGPLYQDVTVSGNRFSGTGTIFWSGNSAIEGLEFTSNELFAGSNNLASRISDGNVSMNTVAPTVTGGLALQIDLHDSTVTENAFDGNDTNRCFQLFGVQFGLDPSTNVEVSDNTFTDCGGPSAGNMWALQLSEGVDQIDIHNNDFTNTKGDTINTRLSGWTLNPDIHVNFNNITGSTGFGINNTAMGVLDGECNWWGSGSGPTAADNPGGTGDAVSANVDYRPWLDAPAPGGGCTTSTPPSAEACKKDGWMSYTDDTGRRFKNQGDCVSYVQTGGSNKADG